MAYDPNRLADLAGRLRQLQTETAAVKAELPDAVQEALHHGVRQVEIVKTLGYTREQVRRLAMSPEARRRITSRSRHARSPN